MNFKIIANLQSLNIYGLLFINILQLCMVLNYRAMKKFFLIVISAIALLNACNRSEECRTISILGDSYSTFDGYIPEGNAIWYSTVPNGKNDVVRVEDTWWHLMCSSGKFELLQNDSFSGSTICNTGYGACDATYSSFITRMRRLVEQNEAPDILFIFGATNDSWANSPIGGLQYSDWTTEDLFNFLPACCYMLDYLKESLPQTQIVFVINTELKQEIVNGIIDACEHYGVSYILLKDIDKLSGHPSILGMQQICSQLTDFVK